MPRYMSDQLHVACIEMETHKDPFKCEIEEVVYEVESSNSSKQKDIGCQKHNNDNEVFHKERSECQIFWVKVIEKVESALNLCKHRIVLDLQPKLKYT